MKKKKAFSLAEVLICISVIAVMYALLTPMMAKYSPKEKKVMLKKSYGTIEKVIDRMINDDVAYPYVRQGFDYTDATTKSAGYDKFCYYFIDSMNTVEHNYRNEDNTGTCTAKTSDGISWSVENINAASNDGYSRKISVDINGAKSPNCSYNESSCKDPDQYFVLVRRDGKIKLSDTYVTGLLADPTNNR